MMRNAFLYTNTIVQMKFGLCNKYALSLPSIFNSNNVEIRIKNDQICKNARNR
jgi:hypothetical protein